MSSHSTINIVAERLRQESERVLGAAHITITVRAVMEREVSTVGHASVAGSPITKSIFIKISKPRDDSAIAREDARARLVRDYDMSGRVYAALQMTDSFGAVRPLACFPEHLALVTAEVPGVTLLQLLERKARWWPSPQSSQELGRTMAAVGGWIRALQSVQTSSRRFSLDAMREYIDIRLRRLLAVSRPLLDPPRHARVLEFFDRTAARVDAGDLCEVFTHADLAPSNVMISDRGVTVIDFAMAAPGGLYMDLARLYTQLEFLTAKPVFRPSMIKRLQRELLNGFDHDLTPDRPLFRLFVLQHLLCHMSNLARNPAPALSRLYNRHQLRLRQQWLETFAA